MTPQPPHALRVLVVEDCDDARESLCLLLRLWRHAFESVPSGSEAVRVAGSFRPDVVLMDIGLPGLDGWATAREMRKLPGLDGARFVATTGYGRRVDVDRSCVEGFAAHLTKPYDAAGLRDLLASLAAERAALKPDAAY